MAKKKIPVSNKQVNETELINSLNSKLLKKEDESVKAIKKRFPGMEKTIDSFVNVLEETLAETENKSAIKISDDALNELNVEADSAYECGTKVVKDINQNFDKIGYASAYPSNKLNDMELKELSPKELDKIEKVISPIAKSITEQLNRNPLKDNEECRKAVNSEVSNKNSDDWIAPSNLTEYGKKVFEAGRKAGKMVTAGKDTNYEMVNHPTHYNQYDIEVIDMIIKIWGPEAAALWCDITAFKYRMRMGTKPDNSIEQDIKKEQWYLNKSKEIRDNLINKN